MGLGRTYVAAAVGVTAACYLAASWRKKLPFKYDPDEGRWVSEHEVQEKLTGQQRQEEFDAYVEATKLLVRAAAVYERTLSESASRGLATPHLQRAILAVQDASNLAAHHFPTWLLPEEADVPSA